MRVLVAVSVLPWLLLGLVATAAVRVLAPACLARAFAARRGLIAALATGALLPTCSRGTVPLAMGLRAAAGVARLDRPELTMRWWRHHSAGGKTFMSDWIKGSTYDMAHPEVALVVSDPEQVILESDPYRRLAYR